MHKPAANTRAAAPPKPQPPAVCKSSHPTEKKKQQEHNARRFVLHNTNYFDKIERMLQRIRNGAGGVHIRPVVCPYPQQSKRRPKPQHVHNMDKYRQHGQPPHIEEVTSPRPIWTTWTTESRHARRCVSIFAPLCVHILNSSARRVKKSSTRRGIVSFAWRGERVGSAPRRLFIRVNVLRPKQAAP